ncbi:MAG: SLC13 family permease [Planctomycetota bacterium]|nr:SLC13 family permease [Planctomycetota bacterium]
MAHLLLAAEGASPGEAVHPEVTLPVTLLFTALLVALIACLALEEKLHAKKSIIAGLFALLALFLGVAFHVLPDETHVNSFDEPITLPLYIPGIDWSVIAIILGSSLFVDVTSRSGLFTWIAIKVTKTSRGDPLVLLILYGLMTVVFSAVLNNVTAMIIVGSLTGVSLRKLGREDKLLGFLIVEGLLTNIGGLLTLISSVPNIIVGTAAEISFVDFFLKTSPYVLIATVATLALGAFIFKIRRPAGAEERERAAQLVAGFDENDGVESRGFFWFGSSMTVLFIAVIATTSHLAYIDDLGMGYVAMGFAAIMLIRFKAVADKFYQAIDWDLLGFFAGLFVVINVMEHAKVLALIGKGLEAIIELPLSSASLLIASAAFSSVTDNIPLAAMLSKILSGLPEKTAANPGLWWAVVFGANLGGNLTPIGSASTLVAVTIIHKYKLPLSFARFVKIALPFALMQIALATVYVLLFPD